MRQALEMALEALEKIATVNAMDYEYQRWAKEHLATIKEALAQPEQEPVACIGYWNQKTGAYYKPDQISAAHKKLIDDGILRRCYTTPPQRTWVGLHTTTILDIYTETLKTHRGGSMPDGQIAFARAIEQALKERNR